MNLLKCLYLKDFCVFNHPLHLSFKSPSSLPIQQRFFFVSSEAHVKLRLRDEGEKRERLGTSLLVCLPFVQRRSRRNGRVEPQNRSVRHQKDNGLVNNDPWRASI